MNKFIVSPTDSIPEGADIIPNAYIDREILLKLKQSKCNCPVFYLHNMELYVSSIETGESFNILYNFN